MLGKTTRVVSAPLEIMCVLFQINFFFHHSFVTFGKTIMLSTCCVSVFVCYYDDEECFCAGARKPIKLIWKENGKNEEEGEEAAKRTYL